MVDSPAATSDAERAATDSPWFWAMLFACGALVGLVVIAPKYTVRHDNVQRQDQGRWEVWRRHGEQTSAGSDESLTDEYVDVRQHEPTFSRSSQTGLWWLRLLLVGLVIATTIAWRRDVWRERRRADARIKDMSVDHVSTDGESTVEPGGASPGAASVQPETGGQGDGVVV